jgi:hypothetical protein
MSKKKFLPGKKACNALVAAAYVMAFASIQERVDFKVINFDHTNLLSEKPTIIVRHISGNSLNIGWDDMCQDDVLVEGKCPNKKGVMEEVERWFPIADMHSALVYAISTLMNKKFK